MVERTRSGSRRSASSAPGLAAHLQDVFRLFGRIDVRLMFGGCGIYREGIMFALVVDDTLYLKADAGNEPAFVRRGLPCFEYEKGGRTIRVAYRQAPAEVLEDAAEAAKWARPAFDAAVRARAGRRASPARTAAGRKAAK